MTLATIDTTTITAIDRIEGHRLAREEYARWATAIGNLSPEEWDRPTDCDGWSIRDMAGHVLGAMRAAASIREQASQQLEIARRVRTTGENQVDVMTALQIERTGELTPSDLVAETRSLVDRAAHGRHRVPAVFRRAVRARVEIGSISEVWRLDYLLDTILTRDILMHRIDLARAIGTQPDMGGEHTRRLVTEIVGEWSRRHGAPFELTLTGAAGGLFTAGTGGEVLELDTVEFLRILSGRGQGTGLLLQAVPF